MKSLHALVFASLLTICVAGCEKAPAPAPASSSATPTAPTPTGSTTSAPSATASESSQAVTAAGISFPLPESWKQVPPANSMRLAEVQVPGPSSDPAQACTIAFSSAGGDVQGNINRWAGQVRDASGQPAVPAVEIKTVGGLKVHVAEMTGTYSGMNEAPRTGWTLRGAIVEAPEGLLFIKMTGPADAMAAAAPGFAAMIDGLSRR